VKPADVALLRIPGRPVMAPDGSILVAVSSPDIDADAYRGTILRLRQANADVVPAGAVALSAGLTLGPRDSEPVIGPDGRLVVFLRAGEKGPAQLYSMPLDGGEPRKLTDHPLGAGSPVFAPDGRRLAYCAAVPEAGRYGTDESVTADAEPPRRITRLSYRLDGEGFVADKPQQLFVLDLAEPAPTAPGVPVQVTDEPTGVADPAFTGDGRLVYVRSTGIDELTDEIAVIDIPEPPAGTAGPDDAGSPERPGAPARGALLVPTRGSAAALAVGNGQIYYLGVDFTGIDAVGRTTGLWAAALTGGAPLRLTDETSVDVDRAAGRPVVVESAADPAVLVAVLDRGASSLRSVPAGAVQSPLDALPAVIDGPRVVRSFSALDGTVAAVVADGATAGEVVTVQLVASGAGGSGIGEWRWTDFSRDLVAAGIRPATELITAAPDGYPVHGWLVAPAGDGPHPVLLLVHGGPHAAYTPALFDEAQVYAGAGYAVVMGNPRGSAGYGQDHGRAVVGAMGTVDVDDVLALLDAALLRSDCDAARVGVLGGSYGGFMTSWLCSQAPGRFTAAISERALNAWDSFAGSSDIGYYFARAYVGADRDSQWRASPLAYADAIDVPLLILHSERDWRCPVEQAQRMFVALKSRGAEVEMLLFPGEGHELSRSGRPRHRVQRFDAILAWWARHLPVPAGPGESGPGESGRGESGPGESGG
jgi:dipeptidyl aminopeptidase/acylaminoacyl peptidase